MVVFAAVLGLTARGVSAFTVDVSGQMVENLSVRMQYFFSQRNPHLSSMALGVVLMSFNIETYFRCN